MHNNTIQYEQCGAYLVTFINFILLYKSPYGPVIEIHYRIIYIYNNNDIVMQRVYHINTLGIMYILKCCNRYMNYYNFN